MQKSSMTVSTILEKFFLLVTFCVCFFCFATPAHALTVSGNLYTDEGTTAGSSGVTIKTAVGTSSPPTLYTTTTGPGGTWTFAFASLATSTPIAVWVDASTTFRGALFTKSSSTVNNISGLKLYKDRVIVSHEGATTSTSTTLADMAFYDNDDDSDIQYNASTTTGILTVYGGNELHVLTGKTFAPSALVDARGNFKVATSSTANLASSSLMVGGDYINHGTASMAQMGWTARSASEANYWTSITYGNGLFVAVAGSGTNRVMTSPDGITWTARSASEANYWNSITYGNGLFVAVSSDGTNRVMTSPDGITWTARTAAEANAWYSVTYGNGLFVAVATEYSLTSCSNVASPKYCVMTSPDGITWTARTTSFSNDWTSVTYGNGLFVAVSPSDVITNRVMTSPDGITWTARSATEANSWYSVTYGNGLFVAVSYNGTNRVMTSPDGITWTARSASEANNWYSVTYGNGLFVAVAGNGTNRVMTSPDGITWTARSASEANNWYSVTYGNGLFVAVALSGTNRVMTSAGGYTSMKSTTTNQTLMGTLTGTSALGDTYFMGTSSKTFSSNASTSNFVVNSGATVVAPEQLSISGNYTNNGTSSNPGGKTWLNRQSATGNWWKAVTYGNGLFVAVSTIGSGNRAMTSPDGVTWTSRTSAADNAWQSITYGLGSGTSTPLFVAVSNDGVSRVMTSPDGITWTARSASEANSWNSITYGNGLFVAVSQDGTNRVMTSPDGVTWTARSASVANQWRSVTYGNGLFVAVSLDGSTNRVMTSPDGVTWTSRTSAADNTWISVTYGNGLFVAVAYYASGSGVMTSPDGITWTLRTSVTNNFWHSVTYGNGLFVAVSYDGTSQIMTSPDGITWTLRTSTSTNEWRSVTYGKGTFVAVSTYCSSGGGLVMTSFVGTTTFTGGSSQTATGTMTGSSAFGNVAFTGAGTKTFSNNASTTNFMVASGATVVAPALLSLSGDYQNSGTITFGTGTTTFYGSTPQTATGTMTGTSAFSNLTITNVSGTGSSTQSVIFGSSASTTGTLTMVGSTSAQFMANATSTFQNINLVGSAGSAVWLRSSIPGVKFSFYVPGTQQSVLYVNVKDSNACPTTIAVIGASGDAGNNTCWTFADSVGLLLSGFLYSDEGNTVITSGKTITIAVGTSTLSLHSTTSNASGAWNFTIPVGHTVASGTPMLVFVDGDSSTRAALFTKALSSIANISNLNLYQNRVIVSHEGTAITSGTNMEFYDNSNDSDIQFETLSGGPGGTFVVFTGNKLYINTGKTFAPGRSVFVNGNASSTATDGALHIASGATYSSSATTTLGGTFTASSTANITNTGTFVFTASTTGKSIYATPALGNVIFANTASMSFATSATTTNLTINAGATVVAPATTLTILGDYTNNGTFTHNGGTTTLASTTQAQYLSGTLSGASGFSTLRTVGNTTTTPSGLIGKWNLDEGAGTTAYDSSGNGNTGTLTNGPLWTTGKVGRGVDLDGTDDYISVGSPATLDDLTQKTITAWINPVTSGDGTFGRILDKNAATANGWIFMVDGTNCTNCLRYYQYSSSGIGEWRTGNGTISFGANTWQHVAMTYDNSSATNDATLYINGAPSALSFDGNFAGSVLSDAANNLWFGDRSGNDRTFNGDMDDVRIYNRILTAGEIATIYNERPKFINAQASTTDLLIDSGVVALASSSLSIAGNYVNSGGFMAGSATTTFNGTSAQTATGTMTGGSAFGNVEFVNAGTKTFAASTSVSAKDFIVGTGATVVAPAQLSISGNYQNSGTFTHNNGTVYFSTTTSGWNVASSTYSGLSKSVTAQDATPVSVTFSPDGTKMYIMGYTNDTVYQYTLGTAWDVSTASYASLSKSVTAQDGQPISVTFSSDGTKMYVAGNTNDTIYQYALGTAWDVSTASYASLSKSVTAQETTPYGVVFSRDGTKMYVVGETNDTVYQYTLGTAWDVSTASYASLSKSVTAQDGQPISVTFSPDGTKMYIMGYTNGSVYQYTLGTAWDVSTASYASLSKSVTAQDATPYSVTFSSDGTKMYVAGNTNDTIYQYALGGRSLTGTMTGTSAFNNVIVQSGGLGFLSNASTTNLTIGSTTSFTAPTSLTVSGDFVNSGIYIEPYTTAYIGGNYTNTGTTSHAGTTIFNGMSAQALGVTLTGTNAFNNLILTNTGTKTFTNNASTTNFTINAGATVVAPAQLSISGNYQNSGTFTHNNGTVNFNVTTYSWDVSTASYASLSKSVTAQDATPYSVTFSSDGTKMYVAGNTNDTIYQYALGTAWDVSTASYASLSKSVTAQETTPYGVVFSRDGTKMYVVGETNDTVYQYTLGTAWDVSTASYASLSKSVTAQDGQPISVTFSPDGTKMYIMGYTNGSVYQYTLGTAWDVSTASYASLSKSVTAQDATPYSVTFSSDGTKMYVAGNTNDTIYQYALGTAWDVSTASYASLSKSVTAQDATPVSITFSLDGTKMYIMGYTNGSVYQYTLGGQSLTGTMTDTSAFNNVIVQSGGLGFLNNASTSNFRINVGAIAFAPTLLSVAGDYTNNGRFVANSGTTVIFDGTIQQTLSGTLNATSAFNGLTIRNTSQNGTTTQSIIFTTSASSTDTFTMLPGTSAQFLGNSTSTFQNINWNGGASNTPIYLRSTASSTPWNLVVPGTQQAVSYVNVRDSHACSIYPVISAGNSVDVGGNTCWTFSTIISAILSSGANQLFGYSQATTSMSTITVTDSSGGITAANDIRIRIATTSVNMRWDTTDTTATLSGTASGKVSTTVSYEDNGATLVLNVTNDFNAGEILSIDGLSYAQFLTLNTPVVGLNMFLAGAGDVVSDDADDKTVGISGLATLTNHTNGQVNDNINSTTEVGIPLFGFNLGSAGEDSTISGLTFRFTGVNGITTSDLSGFALYRDNNSNGTYEAGDTAVGGTPVVSISDETGTVTFSTSFSATSTAKNYLLIGSVDNVRVAEGFTLSLSAADVTITGNTTGLMTLTSSLTSIQHMKGGGGGSPAGTHGGIGGSPPAGDGIRGGGGSGGGSGGIDPDSGTPIGNEVGFNAPGGHGSPQGAWTNGVNAYASNGVYTTTSANGARHTYKTFNFSVPTNNTVVGVEVKVEASGSTAAGTISIALSWNDGTNLTSLKTTSTLGLTDSVFLLGGPADDWGHSWTPSEMANGSFAIDITGNTSSNTISIDAIQTKIYHQATGGGGGGGGAI